VSSTYGVVRADQSVYDDRRRDGAEYYKAIGYSVAKSGVLNFTRWLAEYCAPFGVRVNTLVPGGVKEARTRRRSWPSTSNARRSDAWRRTTTTTARLSFWRRARPRT